MKNRIKLALVALVCFPMLLLAEDHDLENFFDKYQGQKDVSSVSISMDGINISLGNDVDDLFDQIDKFKILHFKNRYKTFRDSEFHDDIADIIKKGDYKLLMDVNSSDEKVKIYIVNGDDNLIKEGLIIAQEDDEASLIWVTGNMNLADFTRSHRHFRNYH